MLKLATLAVAAAIVMGAATTADAYTRNSSSTGPRGNTVSSKGQGSCANGSCSSSQSVTGPKGNSASRVGGTNCSGGTCSGGATYTGPAGNQATRTRNFSR